MSVAAEICRLDNYLVLPDRSMDERIAAAKEALGRDCVVLGHHYQRDEVIMFADFRGVAELGWIAGCGVLLCALACFTVLPALLMIFDRRRGLAERGLRIQDGDREGDAGRRCLANGSLPSSLLSPLSSLLHPASAKDSWLPALVPLHRWRHPYAFDPADPACLSR